MGTSNIPPKVHGLQSSSNNVAQMRSAPFNGATMGSHGARVNGCNNVSALNHSPQSNLSAIDDYDTIFDSTPSQAYVGSLRGKNTIQPFGAHTPQTAPVRSAHAQHSHNVFDMNKGEHSQAANQNFYGSNFGPITHNGFGDNSTHQMAAGQLFAQSQPRYQQPQEQQQRSPPYLLREQLNTAQYGHYEYMSHQQAQFGLPSIAQRSMQQQQQQPWQNAPNASQLQQQDFQQPSGQQADSNALQALQRQLFHLQQMQQQNSQNQFTSSSQGFFR